MRREFVKHLILWIIYYFYIVVSDWILYPQVYLLDYLVYMIPYAWVFYSVYFLLSRFNASTLKGAIFFGMGLILSLGIFYVLEAAYRLLLMPILDPTNKVSEIKVGHFLTNHLLTFVKYFIYALALFLGKKAFKKEKELRINKEVAFRLKEEKFQLEREKNEQVQENLELRNAKLELQQANLQLEKKQIEFENAFLRAQINPHFLHNTLNFFFSKSISAGVYDLADAIMVLSNVMRFSLEAQPDENGRVPISQELDHLKNVIKINEIRFNKPYCLEYRVEGDPDNAKIIPLILITMVENAFKYGELFDPENPVKIHISIHGHQFRFYLHNKKRSHGAKEPTHGIGVKNSVQRLEAAYGANGYSIDIQQDDFFYSLTLAINNLDSASERSTVPIKIPETAIA